MASRTADLFDGKCRDAAAKGDPYCGAMIRTVMSRGDWGTLGVLAVIWGVAFLFIDVGSATSRPSPTSGCA